LATTAEVAMELVRRPVLCGEGLRVEVLALNGDEAGTSTVDSRVVGMVTFVLTVGRAMI